MKNTITILMLLLTLLISPLDVYSFPSFMEIFNNDKFATPEKKNKCSVCHVNPGGGGPLNNFGETFDSAGHKITNNIRQQFPDLFDVIESVEPRISRIKPKIFMAGKSKTVLIKGVNFTEGITFRIDEEDIADLSSFNFVFVNSKTIKISLTFDEPGLHTIQIVNELGQSSNAFKVKVKKS